MPCRRSQVEQAIPGAQVGLPTPCTTCGQMCKSQAAMFSHMAKVHNYRNPLRQKISTDFCECCLLMLWSSERVFYHVKKR
eukprot:4475010-Lingulodinium_polyedra.AAC.1